MGIKRYDLEYDSGRYPGAGDSTLVERVDGDWVSHEDHVADVRQMRRQVITALYWRAGQILIWAEDGHPFIRRDMESSAQAVRITARAMEARL